MVKLFFYAQGQKALRGAPVHSMNKRVAVKCDSCSKREGCNLRLTFDPIAPLLPTASHNGPHSDRESCLLITNTKHPRKHSQTQITRMQKAQSHGSGVNWFALINTQWTIAVSITPVTF